LLAFYAAYLVKLRPIWSSLSDDESSCITFTEALSRSALKLLPRFLAVPMCGISKSATTAFRKGFVTVILKKEKDKKWPLRAVRVEGDMLQPIK